MSRELNRVSPRNMQGRIAGVANALPEHRYPQEVVPRRSSIIGTEAWRDPNFWTNLHTRAGVSTATWPFHSSNAALGAGGETNAAWLRLRRTWDHARSMVRSNAPPARRSRRAVLVSITRRRKALRLMRG